MHPGKHWVLCKLCDETKGDGFDCVPTVAANSRHAVHCRCRHIRMGADTDNALDRVNRCNAVGTAAFCRFCSGAHSGHVGCELGEDRNVGPSSGSSCIALHQCRNLSNIGAEPTVRHIRAGKVQLNCIRTVFLTQTGQIFPFLFILPHDGGQNEFGRVVPLQPPEDLHVLRNTVVGKLFDVLKTDNAAAVACNG